MTNRFVPVLLACALLIVGVVSHSRAEEKRVLAPPDLDSCLVTLEHELSTELQAEMKAGTETDMIRYHFSTGMWMRNEWGLWSGSRLSRWFNDRGIFHPDDMSGIILTSFWRHLNDQPIGLERQIAEYQRYWEEQAQPMKLECPTCGKKLQQYQVGRGLDPDHAEEVVQTYHCRKGHRFYYHRTRGFYQPATPNAAAVLDSLFSGWTLPSDSN